METRSKVNPNELWRQAKHFLKVDVANKWMSTMVNQRQTLSTSHLLPAARDDVTRATS